MSVTFSTVQQSANSNLNNIDTNDLGLGVRPGRIDGTGVQLVGRATRFGEPEIRSNTTKMAEVMVQRGVNVSATLALANAIGHQNGLIDPSNGTIGFNDGVEDVAVKPILGKAQRELYQVLAPNTYPVAEITQDGESKLAVFNQGTRQLEILAVPSHLSADASDSSFTGELPANLKPVAKVMAKSGAPLSAQIALLAHMAENKPQYVITSDSTFSVQLENGQTIGGAYQASPQTISSTSTAEDLHNEL